MREYNKTANDEEQERDEFNSLRRFWGTLLVATLGTTIIFLAVQMNTEPTDFGDIPPQPDSIEDVAYYPGLPDENTERPPLSTLISSNGENITGDVQFLLDFALVGHSKTGAEAQMMWLREHEEVEMYNHELHALRNDRPAELVSLMYALPAGRKYKRAFTSPNDIHHPGALRSLRTYWPQTSLVVGLRHPVDWFASWYNYNMRQGNLLDPAETMLGKKLPRKVRYHIHLAALGKTNVHEERESEMLDWSQDEPQPDRMDNPVFLYEVQQLFDRNETRNEQYRAGLTAFIGLKRTLGPIALKNHSHEGDGGKSSTREIDICDGKYDELRSSLIKSGRNGASWIKTYFLALPDVHVANPEHFMELISRWGDDPCLTR
jgi:hypothetical protein